MSRRVRTHANPLRRFDGLVPPDWNAVFEDPRRPFALEFGSAGGEFLVAHAQAVPGMNILGTEVRKPLVEQSLSLIASRGLRNAHAVYGNIAGRMREFTPSGRVDLVYAFFPDPWIKKKQWKRRLVTPAFLDELAPLLPESASIHVLTDYEPLAAHIRSVFEKDLRFAAAAPIEPPARSPWRIHCDATGRAYEIFHYRRTGEG